MYSGIVFLTGGYTRCLPRPCWTRHPRWMDWFEPGWVGAEEQPVGCCVGAPAHLPIVDQCEELSSAGGGGERRRWFPV